MGNSASSSRTQQEETVDYGYLTPQGVYSGTPDWNQQIVAQLIIERRLAPFYRPLEEYNENWDDMQILAARKHPPGEDVATSDQLARSDGAGGFPSSVSRSGSVHSTGRKPGALKEPNRLPEAMVYRGAVECPICFLFYPPNINHSRCCDQAICTECFVQIKRSEPTTTHVVSEPAACPYCVQDNFGVTYVPPAWRAGIGADGSHSPISVVSSRGSTQQSVDTRKNRRKSFGADSAEVVTIDHIRPDWEAKLAAVRAAVARRANRRIVMRQVGDRLIPVGVTSGRIHPLSGTEGVIIANGEPENSGENEGRSRRYRRRQHQGQPQDQYLGLGGQDLEELMVMEAMRLSLLEHEERQKKEAEEKRKKEAERLAAGDKRSNDADGENEAGPSSTREDSNLPPIPATSPIDVTQPSSRSLRPAGSSPGPSMSFSPGSSSTPRSLVDSSPSPRQSESAISALAANSLRLSAAHSGSSGHSRSGSATPSILASTPRESASMPPFSTLNASLTAHTTASAVLAPGTGENSDGADANAPTSSTSGPMQPNNGPALAPSQEEAGRGVEGSRSLSSLFLGNYAGQSYDALPSSPDSPSQRPLLSETPISEIPPLGLGLEPGKVPVGGTDRQSEAEVPL